MAKSIATSVLQYHIIPGKALSSQMLKSLAATADYVSSTANIGRKLNVTQGGTKLNGYSSITTPDIGTKQSQAIHGISTLLVPPGLIVSDLIYSLLSCIIPLNFVRYYIPSTSNLTRSKTKNRFKLWPSELRGHGMNGQTSLRVQRNKMK